MKDYKFQLNDFITSITFHASNRSKSYSYRLALNMDSMIPFQYVATITYELIFFIAPFDFQMMHSYNRIAGGKG